MPQPTFTINTSIIGNFYEFYAYSFSNSVTNINWGDGTPLQTIVGIYMTHTYSIPGIYTITFNPANIYYIQIIRRCESIDLDGLTSLQSSYIYYYGGSSITFPTLPSLLNFGINYSSNITSLNFTGLNNLRNLQLIGNSSLTSVDFTALSILTSLQVDGCNSLPSLDFTGLNNLTSINITNLPLITSLDFVGLSSMSSINIDSIPNLTLIDLTGSTSLTQLTLGSCNSLSSLDLTGLNNLNYVYLYNIPLLTSLDVSGVSNLSALILSLSLSVSEVNNILSQLVANGLTSGNFGSNQTPMAIPTGQGVVDTNTLRSRNWIVNVDPQYNASGCGNQKEIALDFNGFDVNVEDVVSVAFKEGIYCATIVYDNDKPNNPLIIAVGYSDCYDCIVSNNIPVIITNCNTGEKYFVSLSDLSPTIPNIGDVYYINFQYLTPNGPVEFLGCYQYGEIYYGYSLERDGPPIVVLTPPTVYSGGDNCYNCSTGSTKISAVQDCITNETIYVGLLSDITNHLITYKDLVSEDQHCGVVVGYNVGAIPITGVILSDLGVINEPETCDACLSMVAQKRIITNCITNVPQVVWNSVFFEIGDSSNLSLNDGCYSIGELTDDPVTINEYLDFIPQPDCQECIQCSGVILEINGCDGFGTEYIYSYEYVSIGDVIFYPKLGQCGTVTNISNGEETGFLLFYSLFQYSGGCGECQAIPKFNTYQGTICGTNTMVNVTVTNNVFITIGGYVTVNRGDNQVMCVEIINDYGWDSNYDSYTSDTVFPFETCEDCQSSFQIGLSIINCVTNVQQYVNVLPSDWLLINGSSTSIGYDVIKSSDGICYRISDTCPLTPNHTLLEINEFFYSCIQCYNSFPRAAGVEYEICVSCVDGRRKIITPHATWSRLNGDSVILRDTVELGGPNGLNN